MLDPLADVRATKRVHLPTRARAVCGEPNSNGYPMMTKARAAVALLDIGWGSLRVEGGEVREVMDEMRAMYIDRMSKRVLDMCRLWEREGWVVDSDHGQHR